MNLEDLKSQIYTDLNRADMTAAVTNAINSAIDHYSNERWWFLEGRAYASLSSSQAFYSIPGDMRSPDSLLITVSSAKSPLTRRTYQEIDEVDDGKTYGQPSEWAYYQDNIRLYPVPDGGYTMTLSYHKEASELSLSGSNAWTNEAKDLIRHRAVKEVRQTVIRDYDAAGAASSLEQEAYVYLKRLHMGRVTTSRIRKVDW